MVVLLVAATLGVVYAIYRMDQKQVAENHRELISVVQTALDTELVFALQFPKQLSRFVYASPNLSEDAFTALNEGVVRTLPLGMQNPVIGVGFMDLRGGSEKSFLLDRDRIVRAFDSDAPELNFRNTFEEQVVRDGTSVFPSEIIAYQERPTDASVYSMIFPIFENPRLEMANSENRITNNFGVPYRGFSFVTVDLNLLVQLVEKIAKVEFVSVDVEHPGRQASLREASGLRTKTDAFSLELLPAEMLLSFSVASDSTLMAFAKRHSIFLMLTLAMSLTGLALIVAVEKSRKRAHEMRRASDSANHQKSRFLATMSHEYRTPLNGILGMSELISQEPLTKRQSGHLQTMRRSAGTLLDMVNDLLDVSKIEANELSFDPQECDLVAIIDQCCSVSNVAALTKKIELILDYPLDVPRKIIADGPRIQQIITNLLSNAVKFTSKGHVALELSWQSGANQEEGNLIVVCKDTGIGIEEDKLDHIFKAFSQADISTTREFGGTGLGLTIVKELAGLMGADVRLESTFGEGSKFTVTIPVAPVKQDVANRDIATVVNLSILAVGCKDQKAATGVRALKAFGSDIQYCETISEAKNLTQSGQERML